MGDNNIIIKSHLCIMHLVERNNCFGRSFLYLLMKDYSSEYSFRKICESFNTLHTEIEKLKKETYKETENNENLTSLHARIEDNIQINKKLMEIGNDKLNNLEAELVKTAKFGEQEQHEFDLVHNVHRMLMYIYRKNLS